MQYTIEARELTNEDTHRPTLDPRSRRVTIEAKSADEAISQNCLRLCLPLRRHCQPIVSQKNKGSEKTYHTQP